MRVYIFRHGATSWTKTCQHTGLTDLELSLKGNEEAKSLGESLKGVEFDHVFSSPLKRAQKTCILAGFEEEMKLDVDLVEWNYGDYEGLTTEEIREKVPGWTIFSGDPPNGETSLEIQKRADRFIAKLKNLRGDIAVFSSGHISRVIAARWLNLPVLFGSYLSLSTCSKSVLGFEREYPVILQWNGTSHLNRLE